ncbi:MAG: hypothetical protein AAGJ35_15690, partial [Myxococcota bacterium]
MHKWQTMARPFFFWGLGSFFFCGALLFLRLVWWQDPFHSLLKDRGKLAITLLSDPKTVQALRKIVVPPTQGPSLLQQITTQLMQNDGRWLRRFIKKMLNDRSIQRALRPQFRSHTKTSNPSLALRLGRDALRQLFAQDAKLLRLVLHDLLRSARPKRSPNTASTKVLAQALQTLGQDVIKRLFAQNARNLKQLLKPWTPSARRHPHPDAAPATQWLERIGKYAVDQLFEKRAQNLRAALQVLFGPELMRTLRSARFGIEAFQQQLQQIQIGLMLQGIATATGKGMMQSFLQQQDNTQKQKQQRQR